MVQFAILCIVEKAFEKISTFGFLSKLEMSNMMKKQFRQVEFFFESDKFSQKVEDPKNVVDGGKWFSWRFYALCKKF